MSQQEGLSAHHTLRQEVVLEPGDTITLTFDMQMGGTLRPGRYVVSYQRIGDEDPSDAEEARDDLGNLLRSLELEPATAPQRGGHNARVKAQFI